MDVDANSMCGFHRDWTNTSKMNPLRSVKQLKYTGVKKTSELKICYESISWESTAFSCPVFALSQGSVSGARAFAVFLQTRLVSHFC